MSEMSKEEIAAGEFTLGINSMDLQKILQEETVRFVLENKEEIVKRSLRRLAGSNEKKLS